MPEQNREIQLPKPNFQGEGDWTRQLGSDWLQATQSLALYSVRLPLHGWNAIDTPGIVKRCSI